MSRAAWRVIRTLAPAVVVACVTVPAWTFQSPGPDATVDNTLSEAKRLYEATEYEGAVTALDRAIGLIDARATQSTARSALLTGAYELRARARFGLNDTEGARSDFKSLLEIEPAHRLPAEISPKVVVIFNDVQKALVGVLNLTVVPSDADVQIDNVASRDRGAIAIVAGQHSVTARRAGYGPVSQPVSVIANEAIDLKLTLERVSGVLSLVTVPAEAEVLLDGSARGRTDPMASSPESMPFLLTDLAPGVHVIRVQRPCYVPIEQRLEFKAADYRLEPVRLARAVGALSVTGPQRGTVFVDGKPQGPTPASVDGVCEGPHVVEVRSPVGRYVRRFEMHVGEKIAISADLRPAIALLSVTGLPEGLRGGPDLRLKMEDIFRASSTVTLFAAPAEQVEQLLGREQLRPGWMSFDTVRRPIGEAAASITAGARMELAGKLTRALDVQALAAVTVPSREDTSDVLLTVLAAGSGQPDTVRIKLDDPESVARAVSILDTAPQLFRLSSGLQVADVLDVPGAVVISAAPGGAGARAGVAAGDVILKANTQPVSDGSEFLKTLGSAKVDDLVSLELRDRAGAAKRAELRLVNVPQVVAMVDRTLLSNKLLLDFRRMLDSPSSSAEESVARLNLGVALMRVGSWAEARTELERVNLPDAAGVANGTIQYLLGLCRVALGQPAEAEVAFRRALEIKDGLLTSEGPPIKSLAERELADLARRTPRPLDR